MPLGTRREAPRRARTVDAPRVKLTETSSTSTPHGAAADDVDVDVDGSIARETAGPRERDDGVDAGAAREVTRGGATLAAFVDIAK